MFFATFYTTLPCILFLFFLLESKSHISNPFPKKPYIIGNWKSYLNREQVIDLSVSIRDLYKEKYEQLKQEEIIILPPSLFNVEVSNIMKDTDINVGSQYVSPYCRGAFTGEINTSMLKSIQCKYCLVGHYERRRYFFEGEESIHKSVLKLLQNNIIPIYCIGETNGEYLEGNSISKCINQISDLLLYLRYNNGIEKEILSKIIFAYEPIWAIGTGLIPSQLFLEQLYYSVHNYMTFTHKIHPTIVYGGSVSLYNLKNMKMYDGILLGQSSVNGTRFLQICKEFADIKKL
jgi:triosephosphate isomerase